MSTEFNLSKTDILLLISPFNSMRVTLSDNLFLIISSFILKRVIKVTSFFLLNSLYNYIKNLSDHPV